MTTDYADKGALLRFVKQGVGILSPRLKQLWELCEGIQTWRDEREKERVKTLLLAYNDLLVFLEGLKGKGIGVRTKSGTFGAFPEADADKFSAVITATVEAAAAINWKRQPIDPPEVRKMYQELSQVVQEMSPRILSVFPSPDD